LENWGQVFYPLSTDHLQNHCIYGRNKEISLDIEIL
jgi:hypothetical protein